MTTYPNFTKELAERGIVKRSEVEMKIKINGIVCDSLIKITKITDVFVCYICSHSVRPQRQGHMNVISDLDNGIWIVKK